MTISSTLFMYIHAHPSDLGFSKQSRKQTTVTCVNPYLVPVWWHAPSIQHETFASCAGATVNTTANSSPLPFKSSTNQQDKAVKAPAPSLST